MAPRRKPSSPEPPEPTPTTPGSNLAAAEATVAALRESGKLGEVDGARVQTFLTLARSVDGSPDNASLWREYRAAEETVRRAGDDSDEAAEFVASVRAEVGDTKNTRTPHSRTPGGANRLGV